MIKIWDLCWDLGRVIFLLWFAAVQTAQDDFMENQGESGATDCIFCRSNGET